MAGNRGKINPGNRRAVSLRYLPTCSLQREKNGSSPSPRLTYSTIAAVPRTRIDRAQVSHPSTASQTLSLSSCCAAHRFSLATLSPWTWRALVSQPRLILPYPLALPGLSHLPACCLLLPDSRLGTRKYPSTVSTQLRSRGTARLPCYMSTCGRDRSVWALLLPGFSGGLRGWEAAGSRMIDWLNLFG